MRKEARDEASKVHEDAAVKAQKALDSTELQSREAKKLMENAKAVNEKATANLQTIKEEKAKLDADRLLIE